MLWQLTTECIYLSPGICIVWCRQYAEDEVSPSRRAPAPPCEAPSRHLRQVRTRSTVHCWLAEGPGLLKNSVHLYILFSSSTCQS